MTHLLSAASLVSPVQSQSSFSTWCTLAQALRFTRKGCHRRRWVSKVCLNDSENWRAHMQRVTLQLRKETWMLYDSLNGGTWQKKMEAGLKRVTFRKNFVLGLISKIPVPHGQQHIRGKVLDGQVTFPVSESDTYFPPSVFLFCAGLFFCL